MKVSEISLSTVKDWCGVSGEDSDTIFEALIPAGVSFALSYTGLGIDEADEHEDITVACLVLINDMFYNRTFTVDKSLINPTAEQILRMHSVNMLA